ncbi:MAG: ABC-F family ATP-binding cassette domain-containing protein [Alphaproteobacteria bacterium]
MTPPLLILRNITLSLGDTDLLSGAELIVSERDRICLVGRNGSGKSTLLKIAAGQVEADDGERYVDPGATLRYLPQEPNLTGFETTRAYAEGELAPGDDPHRAQYLLEQLGLTGEENPSTLSGGEARRCAIARTLTSEPDILFLDEPTNHLDLPAIEWLENELSNSRSALVLVSHDRRFLENLSQKTVWLNMGITQKIERSFTAFEPWRDNWFEQEELDRHKLDRKIASELHWLNRGVTARRKRNQGRLSALNALRAERRNQKAFIGDVKLTTTEGNRAGKLVIETSSIGKTYDGAPIVRDLSIRIQRGDRIGIVGPNGAGKTTLLNLLTGSLTPDEGSVRLGPTLQMVTLDQRRESLDANISLQDALTGGGQNVEVGGQSRHVIGYMKDFLFEPEQARTAVSALSGGERGRLMLARALARPSNLLVLDEPTNDLDLETLDLLQEMLSDFDGTVLLVSHDRDFLDRVVTAVVVAEGDGKWVVYAGGYSDMITQRGQRDEPEPKTTVSTNKSSGKGPVSPKLKKTRQSSSNNSGLTFTDKHLLETLPVKIEALQKCVDEYNATLAIEGLYERDPEAFSMATDKLTEAATALAEAEDRWLTLEVKREESEDPIPQT